MIIGTHNTMTYRKPKQWYLRPFKFLARCQGCDYKTQHEKYNVGNFDIRLFWDKQGNIEFRHGGFAYDGSDFEEILKYCEDNDIILRILFEERKFPKSLAKRSKEMDLPNKFKETCKWIEETYPNLKIYGGSNCGTGESLYKFKYNGKYQDFGFYSSNTSLFKSNNKILRVIDDLYPRLYSLLKNKKTKKEYFEFFKDEDNVLLHFDFIEIG